MQLSMDIIADELKDILQYARFPGSTGLTITSVRFLREQADARCSSTLYICRAAPGDIGSDDNLLILGEMPVDAPEGACVLAVQEGLDADAVFNRVLDVFQKYQDWEQKLSLLLKCRAPLEDFLNVSQPILKSGIVLMDWDHNCVAVTRNVHMENCPLWNAILDGYGYKYRFLIEHSNPKLEDITKLREMHQNWSNLDGRYLYNVPLLINGFAMYGIGLHKIEEPAKPYGQSTAQLLQILVQVMTERLSGETRSNLARCTFFDVFIRDVITGKLDDPEEVNRKNNFIPHEDGEYLVAGVIAFKNIDYRTAYLNNCARELEEYWLGSGCSTVGCELLWVANLRDMAAFEFLPVGRQRQLQQWLDSKNATIGFSPAFCSLSQLRTGYQQAKTSLHYGLIKDFDRGVRVFHYFDHFDCQLVEMAAAMADVSTLVHPALQMLLDFDREHNTDYYDTLREYLLNDSGLTLNQMADQMHIHRNTLRYRLDRICEIAQLNMKDEQLKKQMILSIYCFDLFPKIQGTSHLPPRGIAAK